MCPGAVFQYECTGNIRDDTVRWFRCTDMDCIDFARIHGPTSTFAGQDIPGVEITLDAFNFVRLNSSFVSTLTVNVSEFNYDHSLILQCGDLREDVRSSLVVLDFTIKCI